MTAVSRRAGPTPREVRAGAEDATGAAGGVPQPVAAGRAAGGDQDSGGANVGVVLVGAAKVGVAPGGANVGAGAHAGVATGWVASSAGAAGGAGGRKPGVEGGCFGSVMVPSARAVVSGQTFAAFPGLLWNRLPNPNEGSLRRR